MRIVGNNPQLSRQTQGTASGAITGGKPVVVNTDGTVTQISETVASVGSEAVFVSAEVRHCNATFDSNSNRVVIAYRNDASSDNGFAVVGSISGTSITYGTPVTFNGATTGDIAMTFDSNSNKVVIVYKDGGNSNYGTAIVGTVDSSDNSISFGSEVVFNSGSSSDFGATFDSSNNKVVVVYKSSTGQAIVGTVSGTSISFGSATVFTSSDIDDPGVTFDSSNNKVVIGYADNNNNNGNGTAIVGTVSGTSISFGSSVVYESATTTGHSATFDSNSNKVVFGYKDHGNSIAGTAVVGTVSGTSISFGTPVVFNSGSTDSTHESTFDSTLNKVIIVYRDGANSSKGTVIEGTVSGTAISFGSETVFNDATTTQLIAPVYDTNANKTAIAFRDDGNSNYGTAVVYSSGIATNLTSENFIGFAQDTVATGQPVTINTKGAIADNMPQVASASDVLSSASTYGAISTSPVVAVDTANNRIVIAGRDADYGTGKAIVGTIDTSNDTVSFGSFAEFEDGNNTENFQIVFDSNSNKVVIVYTDSADSGKGKAVVGTVSGTSISFGTIVEFESGATSNIVASFDSNSNKVVIVYKDGGNSFYFTSIVGTVSGTDISFGTAVVIVSSNYSFFCNTFDSSNNKVVVGLRGASSHGQAYVGTVSGTGISWGTVATFHTSAQPRYMDAAFDTNVNKVIFSYMAGGDSSKGYAVVGTVSGTDITFGTPTKFHDATTSDTGIAFDSTTNKFLIAYKDDADSDKGKYITGSISGTTPSFGSETVLDSGRALQPTVEYDTGNKRTIINYRDTSGVGTIKLFSHTGSLEDLTPAQTYFVQTDGTLSQTADDPSVTAGTAVAGSTLIVKG